LATNRVTNPSSRKSRCIVIGAGIAGLSVALALEQSGFSVLIIEKAEQLDEVGAGLQLSPNATSILSKLGVLDDLLARATVLQSIDLMSARSVRRLLRLETQGPGAAHHPFLSVHRSDLQASLLRKVRLCPDIELQLGAVFTGHDVGVDTIDVRFSQKGETYSGSAICLIGADGVGSALRATKAEFSGYIAHRQTIDRANLASASLNDDRTVKAFLSPDAHLVAYPISGGRQVNLVYITRQGRQGAAIESQPGFAGFAPTLIQDLVGHTDWTRWPIYTIPPTAIWRIHERTILIGDAAHAMLPFGAQGAAMAIEDAFTLAHCIDKQRTNIAAALDTYETHRRQRVLRVAERAKLNAFAYHAAPPVAWARNWVFAAKGQRLMRDLDWLYAYRVPGIT
jgi:salicylate hydroxylase